MLLLNGPRIFILLTRSFFCIKSKVTWKIDQSVSFPISKDNEGNLEPDFIVSKYSLFFMEVINVYFLYNLYHVDFQKV